MMYVTACITLRIDNHGNNEDKIFQGSKFAMYIVLPHTLTGVNHIVNQINPFTLASDMWNMQEMPLDVWIPKFKFEFTSHLEHTLREVIY